jgi:tRNA/rRNA methyltransferase
MHIRIVLVGPEYQQNIGYCARVMANFGFEDLWIVGGVKIGKEAIKYSKHGVALLKGAKKAKGLKDATRGCSLVVGTTAILPGGRNILRTAISPRDFVKKFSNTSARIALLFGREGTGLSTKELGACDIVVRIPASDRYATLNLSHALAVILYEITANESKEAIEYINPVEKKMLERYFSEALGKMKGVRSKKTVELAFRRVMARGIRSGVEARALLLALRRISEMLK